MKSTLIIPECSVLGDSSKSGVTLENEMTS